MRVGSLVFFALAVFCSVARGVGEEGYDAIMRTEVLPFAESGRAGSFVGEAGIEIAYLIHEAERERGALVILPGKSESFLKYAEVAYDLRGAGYSLYLMDHRGTGLSGELLRDAPGRTHVERFDDYIRDLDRFVGEVVNARPHTRRILLAHSMGGAIALLYLESRPGVFDGAILCAPMLRIITDPVPEALARAMSAAAVKVGLGSRYCPGRGPYAREAFEENIFTRSRVRWSRWEEALIPSHSFTGLGGPTLGWLRASMAAGEKARRDAGRVGVPVLLLQAGDDGLVRNDPQDEACRRMARCEMCRFPGARHEILMERDAIRTGAIDRILEFLERIAPGPDASGAATESPQTEDPLRLPRPPGREPAEVLARRHG